VQLYLMRHGEARSQDEDPERPLTEAGRATVERVASRAALLGFRVDRLYHSGILRARQTAAVLARHLGAGDHLEERAGLAPLDPVGPVADWLLEEASSGRDQAIAIVGHLPFLARLAGRLVAGDETAELLLFPAGALVKLVPQGRRDRFAVAWVLAPELLQGSDRSRAWGQDTERASQSCSVDGGGNLSQVTRQLGCGVDGEPS
jgi:phosphohistidine phosphatase